MADKFLRWLALPFLRRLQDEALLNDALEGEHETHAAPSQTEDTK